MSPSCLLLIGSLCHVPRLRSSPDLYLEGHKRSKTSIPTSTKGDLHCVLAYVTHNGLSLRVYSERQVINYLKLVFEGVTTRNQSSRRTSVSSRDQMSRRPIPYRVPGSELVEQSDNPPVSNVRFCEDNLSCKVTGPLVESPPLPIPLWREKSILLAK